MPVVKVEDTASGNPFHESENGEFTSKEGGSGETKSKKDIFASFVSEQKQKKKIDFGSIEIDDDLKGLNFDESENFPTINGRSGFNRLSDLHKQNYTSSDYSRIHGWGGYIETGHAMTINSTLRRQGYDALDSNDKEVVDTLDRIISKCKAPQNIRGYKMNGPSWFADKLGKYISDSFDVKKNEWGKEGQVLITNKASGREINSSDKQQICEILKQKGVIGKLLQPEKGFSSFSLVEGDNVFTSRFVKMLIDVEKGDNMFVTQNMSESEAILGRNTQFYIKDIFYSKGGWDDGKINVVFGIVKRKKRG